MVDLAWRLTAVMDVFGPVPLDELGRLHADELVTTLCEERLAIEFAREQGAPLMRDCVNPRTGTTFQMRRRGLSNSSIRKALDGAQRVLRDAKACGELTGEVPDLKSAAPKASRPRRSFLQPHELAAMLRAAEQVEESHRGLTWEKVAYIRSSSASAVALARELRVSDVLIGKVRRGLIWKDHAEARNRNDVPRRMLVETLALAGPRVTELCRLLGGHVDVAAARLSVPRTKTDASERVVPLVPALREHLAEHRMDYPGRAGDPVFPTRTGRAQSPDNVRSRILTPLRQRANELLEAEGHLPIAHLTPHTLRRTFASILAECDVPPRRAMYLLGHTDATMTLGVYQQVLDMGGGAVAALEDLLGCTRVEARAIFAGERDLRTNCEPGAKTPSEASDSMTWEG